MSMKLRHMKTLLPPTDGMCKVTAICFSPNNRRLAVITVERIVYLFDENGERKDKFSTKPREKGGPKTYMVTGMAFSPDSTKLAVAQTDNIVFVYRLGLEWGDKKTVANRFYTESPVTTVCWPSGRPNDVVFGQANGAVLAGHSKAGSRAAPCTALYDGGSFTVSSCASPDGLGFLSGHSDGSIYRFHFGDGTAGPVHQRFAVHSAAPQALSWGQSVLAAGNDGRVTFYSDDGAAERTFDYSDQADRVKGFQCASCSPGGDSMVVGNFDCFFVYALSPRSSEWEEAERKDVSNLYTVSALAWKPDGSRVALGALCGVADLLDACVKRVRYKGKFEFTYVSPSQVIVKRLSNGARIVLRSSYDCEVTRINIYRDRFLVAHTPETLLLGDLESCKLSEVAWRSSGKERFNFDHQSVALVFSSGEIAVVEYGRNETLGGCRTEHMNSHLLSVRINERPPSADEIERMGGAGAVAPTGLAPAASGAGADVPGEGDAGGFTNKKLAYLMDAQTARVVDLATGETTAQLQHDTRIDWLELNGRCNLLLFRDTRRRLYLYNIYKAERHALLTRCSYVQWVPDSDVVVAQSGSTLCMWYNIYAPDKVTTYEIKGDVEEIERVEGRTEVVVDEGINTAAYTLNEGLIAFGTALDDRDYPRAIDILEGLELTPETEGMWKQLGDTALKTSGDLAVAHRCAAAVGDVARARFLSKTLKLAKLAERKLGGDGRDFWMVRARMAQLRGDLRDAEGIMVDVGKLTEVIVMYQTFHMWGDAVDIAESRQMEEAAAMQQQYFEYLQHSGQEDKAAAKLEKDHDQKGAVALYLKGGYPGKALNIITSNPRAFTKEQIEEVAAALAAAEMPQKAGQLFETLGDNKRAMDAYVRGNAYRSAVDLARRVFPGDVVPLEKAWGDWLVSRRQVEAAIPHYIEARAHTQAIEAALQARQYTKASQLIRDSLTDPDEAGPYLLQLARHFASTSRFDEAARCYADAGSPEEGVQMYATASRWPEAHRLAQTCMSEEDMQRFFLATSRQLKAQGSYKQAEKVLLEVGLVDEAIGMYKQAKQYDAMVRLVAQYRRNHLQSTHELLAKQLEAEGDFRAAERHYVEGGKWDDAVRMYRKADDWAEARRVARTHGGPDAADQVAFAQAVAIGGEEGERLLRSRGLMRQAVDYLCRQKNFDRALEVARKHSPEQEPAVLSKRGYWHEDHGRYQEAEEDFVAAEKPREAIEMWLHAKKWTSALRLAEDYDPASVPRVLLGHGQEVASQGDYEQAERLFLDAKKPEEAIDMYINARDYPEALRVCKANLPSKVAEVNARIQEHVGGGGAGAGAGMGGGPVEAARGGAGDRSRGGEQSQQQVQEMIRGRNPIEVARGLEDGGQANMAIDAYLAAGRSAVSSESELVDAWLRAVQIAQQRVSYRYSEVASAVGNRLAEMGDHERAGDLLAEVSQFKSAIDCYVRAKAWDKAKALTSGPAKQFADYVQAAHTRAIVKRGGASGQEVSAAIAGDGGRAGAEQALEELSAAGRWEEVLELAAKTGESQVNRHGARYLRMVVSKEDPLEAGRAAVLMSRFGAPAVASESDSYERLLRLVLGGTKASHPGDDAVVALREVLYGVVARLRKPSKAAGAGEAPEPRDMARLDRLLLCSHYASMRVAVMKQNLPDVGLQLSIALLRYCDLVPPDRAYLEASMAAKERGKLSLAFVLSNRLLDVVEAVEDQDVSTVDNDDFEDTDLPPPSTFRLPRRPWLTKAEIDDVRNWVLQKSMDDAIDTKLQPGDIPSQEQAGWQKCVASGFPVAAKDMVRCSACESQAIRSAWNAVVGARKACPWCGAAQTPYY